jgi:hypothetical protein
MPKLAQILVWRRRGKWTVKEILVWRHRGQWAVKCAMLDRTFSNELAAIKAGIDWANEAGKNGTPAVVLCRTAKEGRDRD